MKKPKVGKAGPVLEKPLLYIERDPQKLVNYVCGSNIYNEGEDVKVNFETNKKYLLHNDQLNSLIHFIFRFEIKIKDESEYPEWLWDIHVGPPKKLDELDPNTKEYWRRLRKESLRQNNRLAKQKRRKLS